MQPQPEVSYKGLVSESANQRVKFFQQWLSNARSYWPGLSQEEAFVISISLNGEMREVPGDLTLSALLEWMKVPADRVAVERNLEIVPRRLWSATAVAAGDRLEIVHFVGGGTQDRGVSA